MIVLDGEPVSTIGIGIIVLIMSYLLLDSIREQINKSSRNVSVFLEQIYHEDTEKWNERCMDIINLQKASYTAAKKNTAMLEDKLQQIIAMQEKLNQEKLSSLQHISDLQLKFLEGQKNALNIEVNYNNKNTKLLLQAIQEEVRKLDNKEQLAQLIDLLEQNYTEHIIADNNSILNLIETEKHMKTETNEVDHFDNFKIENENNTMNEENKKVGDLMSEENAVITPLYDDPNKALTVDEIAALFSTYGK